MGQKKNDVHKNRSRFQYIYTLSFTCNSTAELGKSSNICSWSSSILIIISFLLPKKDKNPIIKIYAISALLNWKKKSVSRFHTTQKAYTSYSIKLMVMMMVICDVSSGLDNNTVFKKRKHLMSLPVNKSPKFYTLSALHTTINLI